MSGTNLRPPAIAAAEDAMGFEAHTRVDLSVQPREDGHHHRHVAIEWEGGVIWLDLSEQLDYYCVDVRQFVPADTSVREGVTELAGQGVFTIVNGRRLQLAHEMVPNVGARTSVEPLLDPDGTPVLGHGWNGGYVVTLMHDKVPGERQTNRPAGPGRGMSMNSDYHRPLAGDAETDAEYRLRLAETRAKRLADIVDGYEVYEDGMPDSTVPGAAEVVTSHEGEIVREHPRYVLVTQFGDKGAYRLRLGADLDNVEQLAADAVTDTSGGESVICYFDLDVLAGPKPRPSEGDRVMLTVEGAAHVPHNVDPGAQFWVVGSETDTFDGEAYEKLYISTNEGADYLSGSYDALVDEQYVAVIESAYEDQRMPVRYSLAKVVTQVVFNTIPSP